MRAPGPCNPPGRGPSPAKHPGRGRHCGNSASAGFPPPRLAATATRSRPMARHPAEEPRFGLGPSLRLRMGTFPAHVRPLRSARVVGLLVHASPLSLILAGRPRPTRAGYPSLFLPPPPRRTATSAHAEPLGRGPGASGRRRWNMAGAFAVVSACAASHLRPRRPRPPLDLAPTSVSPVSLAWSAWPVVGPRVGRLSVGSRSCLLSAAVGLLSFRLRRASS